MALSLRRNTVYVGGRGNCMNCDECKNLECFSTVARFHCCPTRQEVPKSNTFLLTNYCLFFLLSSFFSFLSFFLSFFFLSSTNGSPLNLFFLGIFYGTIASIITWILVPKLPQLGYPRLCLFLLWMQADAHKVARKATPFAPIWYTMWGLLVTNYHRGWNLAAQF